MEGTSGKGLADAASSLSWPEVQEICGEMEKLFRADARKDAQRLRSLIQKRKEIATTCQTKQNEANKQLQHLLANVHEWEQQEATARTRNEQLQMKLQELEAIKREMTVQLERLRVDEQSSKESLEKLLDKYEETRQQIVQYSLDHQNDIPLAKHQMSLCAAVTGIKWDFSGSAIAGDIHVPAKQTIVRFEIDPESGHFEAANALWDKIDAAFEDVDNDL